MDKQVLIHKIQYQQTKIKKSISKVETSKSEYEHQKQANQLLLKYVDNLMMQLEE